MTCVCTWGRSNSTSSRRPTPHASKARALLQGISDFQCRCRLSVAFTLVSATWAHSRRPISSFSSQLEEFCVHSPHWPSLPRLTHGLCDRCPAAPNAGFSGWQKASELCADLRCGVGPGSCCQAQHQISSPSCAPQSGRACACRGLLSDISISGLVTHSGRRRILWWISAHIFPACLCAGYGQPWWQEKSTVNSQYSRVTQNTLPSPKHNGLHSAHKDINSESDTKSHHSTRCPLTLQKVTTCAWHKQELLRTVWQKPCEKWPCSGQELCTQMSGRLTKSCTGIAFKNAWETYTLYAPRICPREGFSWSLQNRCAWYEVEVKVEEPPRIHNCSENVSNLQHHEGVWGDDQLLGVHCDRFLWRLLSGNTWDRMLFVSRLFPGSTPSWCHQLTRAFAIVYRKRKLGNTASPSNFDSLCKEVGGPGQAAFHTALPGRDAWSTG